MNAATKIELARLLRVVARKALEIDDRRRLVSMEDDNIFRFGVCLAIARVRNLDLHPYSTDAYSDMADAQDMLGVPRSLGRYGDWTMRPYVCLWMADQLDPA